MTCIRLLHALTESDLSACVRASSTHCERSIDLCVSPEPHGASERRLHRRRIEDVLYSVGVADAGGGIGRISSAVGL